MLRMQSYQDQNLIFDWSNPTSIRLVFWILAKDPARSCKFLRGEFQKKTWVIEYAEANADLVTMKNFRLAVVNLFW